MLMQLEQKSLPCVMTRLEEKAEDFHEKNPEVFREFEQRAFRLVRAGAKRIGGKQLFEVMRYDRQIQTQSTEQWKLNNNYVSYYVRWLIEKHPHLSEHFQLRKVRPV